MSQDFRMTSKEFKKKITELFGKNKVTSVRIIKFITNLQEDYTSNCRIEVTFRNGLIQNFTTIASFDGTLGILAMVAVFSNREVCPGKHEVYVIVADNNTVQFSVEQIHGDLLDEEKYGRHQKTRIDLYNELIKLKPKKYKNVSKK